MWTTSTSLKMIQINCGLFDTWAAWKCVQNSFDICLYLKHEMRKEHYLFACSVPLQVQKYLWSWKPSSQPHLILLRSRPTVTTLTLLFKHSISPERLWKTKMLFARVKNKKFRQCSQMSIWEPGHEHKSAILDISKPIHLTAFYGILKPLTS